MLRFCINSKCQKANIKVLNHSEFLLTCKLSNPHKFCGIIGKEAGEAFRYNQFKDVILPFDNTEIDYKSIYYDITTKQSIDNTSDSVTLTIYLFVC